MLLVDHYFFVGVQIGMAMRLCTYGVEVCAYVVGSGFIKDIFELVQWGWVGGWGGWVGGYMYM